MSSMARKNLPKPMHVMIEAAYRDAHAKAVPKPTISNNTPDFSACAQSTMITGGA